MRAVASDKREKSGQESTALWACACAIRLANSPSSQKEEADTQHARGEAAISRLPRHSQRNRSHGLRL